MNRKKFFLTASSVLLLVLPRTASSLAINTKKTASNIVGTPSAEAFGSVSYQPLSLPLTDFGVSVPVACWFPSEYSSSSTVVESSEVPSSNAQVTAVYQHRISVRRIGQLLAGWDFIPEFASRQFTLEPGTANVLMQSQQSENNELPSSIKAPVVILAHGYLGSRFDLSHLAEKLAQQGFVCLAPEYPESLAASYDRIAGLDRQRITDQLLESLSRYKIQASSFGIIGHSMGCGTAVQTGDSSWTRVCIAGYPGQQVPGKNVLFLASMNDGAVSLERFGGKAAIPADYTMLQQSSLQTSVAAMMDERLPSRAAMVLDRPAADDYNSFNHISFLASGVNDAMIDLLSPLLPVAQSMSIPVLDFDKYQQSRDSLPTAAVLHPLVVAYLKQHMMTG